MQAVQKEITPLLKTAGLFCSQSIPLGTNWQLKCGWYKHVWLTKIVSAQKGRISRKLYLCLLDLEKQSDLDWPWTTALVFISKQLYYSVIWDKKILE